MLQTVGCLACGQTGGGLRADGGRTSLAFVGGLALVGRLTLVGKLDTVGGLALVVSENMGETFRREST